MGEPIPGGEPKIVPQAGQEPSEAIAVEKQLTPEEADKCREIIRSAIPEVIEECRASRQRELETQDSAVTPQGNEAKERELLIYKAMGALIFSPKNADRYSFVRKRFAGTAVWNIVIEEANSYLDSHSE